jgi:hypothetical protein
MPFRKNPAGRKKRVSNLANDPQIEAYFAGLSGEVGGVARALRDRIEARGPHLDAKLSYGFPAWQGTSWVLSIVAHKAYCNLQIARGAELAFSYPHRIEGTGKSLRHVKVRSLDALDSELDAIIDAAIRLDAQA